MLGRVNFAPHCFSFKIHVFFGSEHLLDVSDGDFIDPGSNKDAFWHRVSWSHLIGRMLWILG